MTSAAFDLRSSQFVLFELSLEKKVSPSAQAVFQADRQRRNCNTSPRAWLPGLSRSERLCASDQPHPGTATKLGYTLFAHASVAGRPDRSRSPQPGLRSEGLGSLSSCGIAFRLVRSRPLVLAGALELSVDHYRSSAAPPMLTMLVVLHVAPRHHSLLDHGLWPPSRHSMMVSSRSM